MFLTDFKKTLAKQKVFLPGVFFAAGLLTACGSGGGSNDKNTGGGSASNSAASSSSGSSTLDASNATAGSKFEISSYPQLNGDSIDLVGTWMMVGEYQVTQSDDTGSATLNYKSRESVHIRPTNTPNYSSLQICDTFHDSSERPTFSEVGATFSASGFDFLISDTRNMSATLSQSGDGVSITGEFTLVKISNNPEKSLGTVLITADTINPSSTELSIVRLFNNLQSSVSCFAELESNDDLPSFFNFAKAIVPNLPTATATARHELRAEFDSHSIEVHSEKLYGEKFDDFPEGHIVTISLDSDPSADSSPPEHTFNVFGGSPLVTITNLYDQHVKTAHTFYFEEALDIDSIQNPTAHGAITLDPLKQN